MSTVYIVFARFDRLSFLRQEEFIRPAAHRMKSFTAILDTSIRELYNARRNKPSELALSPAAKVFLFLCCRDSNKSVQRGVAVSLYTAQGVCESAGRMERFGSWEHEFHVREVCNLGRAADGSAADTFLPAADPALSRPADMPARRSFRCGFVV